MSKSGRCQDEHVFKNAYMPDRRHMLVLSYTNAVPVAYLSRDDSMKHVTLKPNPKLSPRACCPIIGWTREPCARWILYPLRSGFCRPHKYHTQFKRLLVLAFALAGFGATWQLHNQFLAYQ